MFSGDTCGSNRASTLPSFPIRNFVKFQAISALPSGFGFSDFSHWYSSQALSPLTSIFEKMGKLASNLDVANSRICSSVPGSCAPNWLHGKPRTLTSPCSCNVHRPAYCGVRPHWLAKLTISRTWSRYSDRETDSPVMEFISIV